MTLAEKYGILKRVMNMPRISRQKSESGYYHVILRGVNRQDLFFDDEDRVKILECLERFQKETHVQINAYCLMSNHIHLLVKASDELSLLVKKVASSYVYYFNRKYDRIGHLFQDRFRSEVIDTDAYLLTVYRYILQNPEKAGICKAEEYPWSSWKAMEGQKSICDITQMQEIAGSRQLLKEYVLQKNDDVCLEAETSHSLTDTEALEVALRITDGENPQKIAGYEKEKRDELLLKLKKAGLSIRQISRLTGINRNTIQRV